MQKMWWLENNKIISLFIKWKEFKGFPKIHSRSTYYLNLKWRGESSISYSIRSILLVYYITIPLKFPQILKNTKFPWFCSFSRYHLKYTLATTFKVKNIPFPNLFIFPISFEVQFGHNFWKLKKSHFQICSSVLQSYTRTVNAIR
jgi:hypothetical protein